MFVGYARTSSVEQVAGLEGQVRDLYETGCTRLFQEQVSSVARREQLVAALDFVREGDTLIVTRLDRLARSTADLLAIIAKLEGKGVAVRVLDCGGDILDTKSPTGKMLVTMIGAVAEFERGIMLQRQREGIAKAKAAGKYRGRAPTARAAAGQVHELRAAGLGASVIAGRLKISSASVYRVLTDAKAA